MKISILSLISLMFTFFANTDFRIVWAAKFKNLTLSIPVCSRTSVRLLLMMLCHYTILRDRTSKVNFEMISGGNFTIATHKRIYFLSCRCMAVN
jgi:hypothetical protein